MKPPKRQRKQSAKSQMTQGSGPKRQKTSNRQQRQETDSYNVPPVVSRSNTRTFTDIQTHNDGNNRQNDTSMNAPTPSTSGWPGRNPSHTQTMHDARTHGHISAESSSETLRQTQVSGTETRPVNPAQNTDHELIYQRAAVSQPSMQNDVSMASISTRAQYTADPRSQSNGTLQQGTNLEFSGDSRGLMGMGVVHESQMPTFTPSFTDPISAHIPLKIKEKIWAGEYIDLYVLLKSVRELTTDSQLSGDLSIKGGQLTVTQPKIAAISNIHVWTSAFMIFMGVMLEKWPNKGQEYLKYMFNVRLAASRGSGTGWAVYDEQYRLRKARYPHTPWGDIDMELWLLHFSNPAKYAHFDNTNVSQKLESKNEPFLADFKRGKTPQSQKGNTQRGFRSCWNFNKGKCSYGQKCRYAHKCSDCAGDHPFKFCNNK